MYNKDDIVFAILGGDLRQIQVAEELKKDGYKVNLFGFEAYSEISNNYKTPAEALINVQYVILPLPFSTDGIHLNAPYMNTYIKLSEIYNSIKPNMIVFGGKFNSYELNRRGIRTIDYFEREELQIQNAIPTAEGAIQIAMEERPTTIHGSNCLVVGFGRVGKTLAGLLKGLNANVTVTARKYEDLAWIRSLGCKAENTGKIADIISTYDIIFNTVPAIVIGKNELINARKDSLFIDLASKPGGIDFEQARICGVDTIWSLSLPGKVAPITAGNIIKETIINILDQEI